MKWLDEYIPKAQRGMHLKEHPEKQEGINNDLLLRQSWKESSFRPNVKNSLGYMGLAQVGDAVIGDYKKANKVDNIDPYNPSDAKKIQEWYMNNLYNSSFANKPNQSEEVRKAKALSAYNWGRGNVAKELTNAKSEGIDIYNSLDWLEKLPKETRDYTNKILGKDKDFNKEYDSVSKLPKYQNIVNTYTTTPIKLQDGGIIEDDRGQWAHPGKITKINSNQITMKGVNYPLLGISDTGDVQYMEPNQEYKFDGNNVTEFPLAQNGKKFSNFTNDNTTNWLDKYK